MSQAPSPYHPLTAGDRARSRTTDHEYQNSAFLPSSCAEAVNDNAITKSQILLESLIFSSPSLARVMERLWGNVLITRLEDNVCSERGEVYIPVTGIELIVN